MNNTSKKIGKRIKKVMIDREIDQGRLAEKIGVSRTSLNKDINGKQSMTVERLELIAIALETKISELTKGI